MEDPENGVWADTSAKATDNEGATQGPAGSGTMDPSGPPSLEWEEGGNRFGPATPRGGGRPERHPRTEKETHEEGVRLSPQRWRSRARVLTRTALPPLTGTTTTPTPPLTPSGRTSEQRATPYPSIVVAPSSHQGTRRRSLGEGEANRRREMREFGYRDWGGSLPNYGEGGREEGETGPKAHGEEGEAGQKGGLRGPTAPHQ